MKIVSWKIISVIIIILIIPITSLAKYYEIIRKIEGNAIIAEPIVVVEKKQEKVISDFNKNTVKEYGFLVKNYKYDERGNKRISEVDFIYNIEIKNSSNNFPVKYELYDCSSNEEILKGNNKTSDLLLLRNQEYENEYKLIVSWNEVENLDSQSEIDILINASQLPR